MERIYTLSSKYQKIYQHWGAGEGSVCVPSTHKQKSFPVGRPLLREFWGPHSLVTPLKVEVCDESIPGGVLRDLSEPDRLVSFG